MFTPPSRRSGLVGSAGACVLAAGCAGSAGVVLGSAVAG